MFYYGNRLLKHRAFSEGSLTGTGVEELLL